METTFFFEKDIISLQNNQLLDGGLRVNRFPSGVLKVVGRKRGQVTCSLHTKLFQEPVHRVNGHSIHLVSNDHHDYNYYSIKFLFSVILACILLCL